MVDTTKALKSLDAALSFLLEHYTDDPQASHFNQAAIKTFEELTNRIPMITAGMTKTAALANAATLVGSTHIIDYLVKDLGLSQAEAWARARRAEEFFGDVLPAAKPAPETDPNPTAETPQERSEREAREAADRKRRREQAAQRKLAAEKVDIINQELGYLNKDTTPSRSKLYELALVEASNRRPEDLRAWVRAAVEKANHRAKDPFAATKNRYVHVGKQDANGGCRISIYLDGEGSALFHAALAGSNKKGHGLNLEDPSSDRRSFPQRKADALIQLLKDHNSAKVSRRGGVGSIVVSMSAKDVEDLPEARPDKRFPTNTGVSLTASEILRLGAARYDFGAVLDPESGRTLHLGRTSRSASLNQRLALLASELVCSGEDCDEPADNSDVHHIEPWYAGGVSDIENFTFRCFKHHPDNDDTRTGQGNKGYADHDPESGRVGHRQPDGTIRLNESTAQQESGGAKIRGQNESRPPGCPF